MPGTLYLVATPIGNLSDVSTRALKTLREVDLIACEDTRHTRKLLTHFGISNKLVSYHEHNELSRVEEFARDLLEGKNIAVVSDAGTPAICDPSLKIVQKAHELKIKVVPIPGAVAFVNAVIVSGLPTDSIFFGGFLPSKKTERLKRLQESQTIPATLVFYESPHRLEKSVMDCLEILGNRQAVVVRELTKLHEEIIRGDLEELTKIFASREARGEIVLVIDRQKIENQTLNSGNQKSIAERIIELESEGFDHKTALKKAAREFNLTRSAAYRQLLMEKSQIKR